MNDGIEFKPGFTDQATTVSHAQIFGAEVTPPRAPVAPSSGHDRPKVIYNKDIYDEQRPYWAPADEMGEVLPPGWTAQQAVAR